MSKQNKLAAASSKQFEWADWKRKLPELHEHSEAKLKVVSEYIEDYITILCTGSPGQDRFRLTLVDGFAGGGVYAGEKSGSPFVLMEAVRAAQERLCLSRKKPIFIDCHFYFVESDRDAFECLSDQLLRRGYAAEIGKSIFPSCASFAEAKEQIITNSHSRYTRGGSRVIFFLDQCGYNSVPAPMLRDISRRLHNKAEFIVNIAIDWLTIYFEDQKTFSKVFPSLGLHEVLSEADIRGACNDQRFSTQYIAESMIGPAYHQVSGLPFFSPFYIQSPNSGRGYWLVHLAPQLKARSAMLDVLWRHSTGCRHFGHPGMNMLSYMPQESPQGYLTGMEFGAETKALVQTRIQSQIAKMLHDSHHDGLTFQQFKERYSNATMASDKVLERALLSLSDHGEVVISGKGGGAKRVESVCTDDVIKPTASKLLIYVPKSLPPDKITKAKS